jgi:hypothetical protein
MGRRKLDNRKINKSGRFDPELIEKIEKSTDFIGLNFSQTLEFFAEICIECIDQKTYDIINKTARRERKTFAEISHEILKSGMQGRLS